ncbi:MAG TPA: glycosyltransferase, partial [Thiothrix sp.]|nr:glycosyltransferase [Thiothrix sp.]
MFGLISIITALASYWLLGNLPSHLPILLKTLILIPFVILLFWLELGFFTALLGFWMLSKHKKMPSAAAAITPSNTGMTHYSPPDHDTGHASMSDHGQVNHLTDQKPSRDDPTSTSTTAILLPIYNEDVAYVYAGLKSIYQSLQAHHCEQQFEFYILSDSDKASYLLKEGAAWTTLCEELNAKGRIHYRHRKHRVKKKSGNIMDFCRRWGNLHPYMIVLDADSLMGAKTLTTLVSMMDENPNVGLIQAPLYSTGMDSLFARSQ